MLNEGPPIPSASGAGLQSKATIAYANLSNKDLFQLLSKHGCKDLSSHIHPNKCSKYSVNGGGYGDIYKGKTRDGTDVAIKVLRRSSNLDPKTVKHAMQEVYRWSKVRHPNLHELMGVIDFRGQLGMVSSWMEHGDLRSFILRNPEIDRYPWCIQVAAGVSYLHTNGMIHGDLKAMNILVSQDLTIKISDFDCSIVSDCSLVFSATGQAISLRWAAPELMDSSEDGVNVEKTRQSDVYALGMTLLEIVTGEAPYSEYRFDVGVMKAVVAGELPRRPAALREGNRKDVFWNLLEQCWNHDQTARPSAQRVLTTLQFETGSPEFKDVGPSLQDMFELLLRRGCADLSSQMDSGQDDAMVVAGGAFGDIWKGKLYDGTEVAIKTMRISVIYKYSKRVLRETYTWSRFAHLNVHQLLGVIVFRDFQLGMVSRWMENGDMHGFMWRVPKFDRYQACIQITSGLAYMHHQGTVHGDMKASNVLVSTERATKLSGFNFSIVFGYDVILWANGGFKHESFRWAASELILKGATISQPSDVYSLGMTFLEIFTGKAPYSEYQSYFHIIKALEEGTLPTRPMDRLGNDDRSNRMWELMVSCWNRDPAARPTAAEVLELTPLLISAMRPEQLNTISSIPLEEQDMHSEQPNTISPMPLEEWDCVVGARPEVNTRTRSSKNSCLIG